MSAPVGTPSERAARKKGREEKKTALQKKREIKRASVERNKEIKAQQKERGKKKSEERTTREKAFTEKEKTLLSGKNLTPEQGVQARLLKMTLKEGVGAKWNPKEYTGPNAALYNSLGKALQYGMSAKSGKTGLLTSAKYAASTIERASRDKTTGKIQKDEEGKTVKTRTGKALDEPKQYEAVKKALLSTLSKIESGTLPKGGKRGGKVLPEINEKTMRSYFQRTVMTQARTIKSTGKIETETAASTVATAKGRGGEKPKVKIGRRPKPK
jgi:hypothetical protein